MDDGFQFFSVLCIILWAFVGLVVLVTGYFLNLKWMLHCDACGAVGLFLCDSACPSVYNTKAQNITGWRSEHRDTQKTAESWEEISTGGFCAAGSFVLLFLFHLWLSFSLQNWALFLFTPTTLPWRWKLDLNYGESCPHTHAHTQTIPLLL